MTYLDNVLSIQLIKTNHPNLHREATAELLTLRAQIAEAREIISGVAEISPWSLAEADFLRQKAKAYLDKVTTA